MTRTIVAIQVPAYGPPKLIDIADDLDALRQAIGGGWVQPMPIQISRASGVMWVDEEGRYKTLPYNFLASIIFARDSIVGDAIITGPAHRNGDTMSVSIDLIAAFRGMFPDRLVMPDRTSVTETAIEAAADPS